jgi:hypothetical protein
LEEDAMKSYNIRILYRCVLATFLLLSPVLCNNLFAGTHVSGGYASAGGTNIVLTLSVQTTAPANLIIEQYMSRGNRVLSTSPRAKKIEGGGARIKWLVRNFPSGSLQLSTRLRAPLAGNVKAVIKYRDPDTGQFTEIRIAP